MPFFDTNALSTVILHGTACLLLNIFALGIYLGQKFGTVPESVAAAAQVLIIVGVFFLGSFSVWFRLQEHKANDNSTRRRWIIFSRLSLVCIPITAFLVDHFSEKSDSKLGDIVEIAVDILRNISTSINNASSVMQQDRVDIGDWMRSFPLFDKNTTQS